MKLETFFDKFDLFADAPDSVAKMRGMILRLAMQGKLSEPHQSDVPVSDLLRDVEKERSALGIKRSRDTENGSAEAGFVEIPSRWTWTRFGELARHNAGKTLDKGRNRGELRDYITTSNLYWGFFKLGEVRQMPIQDEELERCTATKGDLLIVEGGEAGRAAVWCHDNDIAFQNHIHRARFFGGIDPYFIQRYFETLNATGEIERFRKGVGISNMSGKALASVPIPLPPLAEQKRIVAKVDELMALCDRLALQQQDRESRERDLARAALARFAEAPTPANLDLLFHQSFAVPPADLRKSILTLAVQGKLIAENIDDERPAKRERYRSAELNNVGIPDHWAVAPLADVAAEVVDCPHSTPKWTVSGKICVRTNQFKPGALDLSETKFVSNETFEERIRRLRPLKDDILYSREGGILGIACLVPPNVELCLGQRMMLIRAGNSLAPAYLELVLNTPLITEIARRQTTGGAAPRVNVSTVKSYPIPIPPLAEQKRIVAKVDELMALVDQLEAQRAAARTTAERLLEAAVAELTTV